MATLDIDDFDLTPYQMAPLLPAESTVTLAVDLHACKPSEPTLQVEKTAKKMYEAASELKQVFITRVELAGINLRMRMMFDTVSDRFWVVTRQQVLHWANYAHEGMDMLSGEEKAKIDHADKLEKAEVARELDKHLFSDGLKFLAKPFNIRTPKRGSTEETNDTNEPEGEGLPLPNDMLEGAPEAEAEDGDSE